MYKHVEGTGIDGAWTPGDVENAHDVWLRLFEEQQDRLLQDKLQAAAKIIEYMETVDGDCDIGELLSLPFRDLRRRFKQVNMEIISRSDGLSEKFLTQSVVSQVRNNEELAELLDNVLNGLYVYLASGDNGKWTHKQEGLNASVRTFGGRQAEFSGGKSFSEQGRKQLKDIFNSEKYAALALAGEPFFIKSQDGSAGVYGVYMNISEIGHRCAKTVEILEIADMRAMRMSGKVKATVLNSACGGQGQEPFLKKDESKPIGGLVSIMVAELETGICI